MNDDTGSAAGEEIASLSYWEEQAMELESALAVADAARLELEMQRQHHGYDGDFLHLDDYHHYQDRGYITP